MGACTMGSRKLLLPAMILGMCQIAIGAVADVRRRAGADRRRNPRVGHRDQSRRQGTSAGTRHRQGRRAALRRRRDAPAATAVPGQERTAPTLIKSDGTMKNHAVPRAVRERQQRDGASLAVRDRDVGLHQPRHAARQRRQRSSPTRCMR